MSKELTALPGGIREIVDGRYEVRRELGRSIGGFVFEASHRFTRRSVVLTVVAPEVPRDKLHEVRARFVSEARALATARHPGIVEVIDGGVARDGTPYFVTEKLEGRTLEGLLAGRAKLTPQETSAIALHLCDALEVAHAGGIVHRDLRLDRIFIVRDESGAERIKVTDFGAAQRVAMSPRPEPAGTGVRTHAYMCPEQLLALDRVDHLGDIYALGVIMFECLTGRLPCDGDYQSVLRYASSGDAPPRVEALVPEVGERLGSIVQRAMAKKREDRFPSALHLARALHEAFPAASGRTFFLGPAPVPRYAVAEPADATQRRRTPRVPYVTPVRVTLPDGTGLDGRSEDISEGGLLVITRQPCEVAPRISLQFALPLEGTTETCDAVVRWVRAARQEVVDGPRALGLEFIDPPAIFVSVIKRYVEIMAGGG